MNVCDGVIFPRIDSRHMESAMAMHMKRLLHLIWNERKLNRGLLEVNFATWLQLSINQSITVRYQYIIQKFVNCIIE